ncbi:hypothetical protein BN1708_014671 [Verticillium longisporum]|uniref:C2H2-type domain-containing protein n=1 Tax=Verticillium longisporum TaxID=100787 RepID=A0A0G4LXH6_VERLO|nr:hypothetical protein BN1708_014671 [Verticillium longisporum]
MDHTMQDAPADVLVEARRTLEALKSSGLSREVLLEMWEAGDRSSQSSTETVLEDASTRGSSSTLSSPSTPLTGLPPPPAICHGQIGHRPRISVSSTSSGSSGHASIWSMGSMNSNASISTHYSQPAMGPSSQSQSVPQHSVGGALPQVASAQTGWGPGRFNFYWCTSCETRFKRKYDWKRHEEEFHERWKKYPCPEPGCNRSFWGANTFNQHHKSSHGCKTCPHSEKVVKYLKRRKYWACGFCSALHPSRERHVEHVARHFESGKTKSDWMHSRVVYGLLHQPLIHEAWKDILMGKAAEFAGRQPNFSWNPTQTGRAQGFMENECPGQLQDLLEFFSGSSTEAESIVSVAYELADLVFLNVPASPPMDYAQCYPPQPTTLAPPPPPQAYPPQPLLPPPAIPSQTLPTQQPSPPVVPSQEGSHQPFVDQMRNQQQQQQQMDQMRNQQQQMDMDHMRNQQHMEQMRSQQQHMDQMRSQQQHQQHQQQQQQQQQHMMPPPLFHQGQPVTRASSDPIRHSLDRELPPPPQEAPPMNFNYMPNNVVFEDWESFGTTVVDDHSSTPTPVSAEWPMVPVQYYHHTPVGQ